MESLGGASRLGGVWRRCTGRWSGNEELHQMIEATQIVKAAARTRGQGMAAQLDR